jgi:hypothetical protein
MINYDYQEIKNKIDYAKKNNIGVFFKNFLKEEFVPNWQNVLDCVYGEYQEPTDQEIVKIIEEQNEIRSKSLGEGKFVERLEGRVIIGQHLFITPLQLSQSSIKKYFKNIEDLVKIFEEKCNIKTSLVGPKICIGPYQNGSHIDEWDVLSLHCEGTATWTLSDKRLGSNDISYKETFFVEKGDLIFFPQGMWHEVSVTGARASLQFNCPPSY